MATTISRKKLDFITTFQSDPINLTAELLILIGALNLLSIGFQRIDYIAKYAGQYTPYVFILIGLAGLFFTYKKIVYFYTAQFEKMGNTDDEELVRIIG